MGKIAINFVPLKNQDFTFNVFRKLRDMNDSKNEDRSIFSLYLPPNDEPRSPYLSYWLSFEYRADFEQFKYTSKDNIHLTNRYIHYLLEQGCNEKLQPDIDYSFLYSTATKQVRFVIRRHSEGDEVVSLSSYFLELTQQHGFLLEYKFIKDENQTFNRKVQQLSLSLNKEFKSNNNLYFEKFEKLKEFAKQYYRKIFSGNILDFGGFSQIEYVQLAGKRYIFGNGGEDNYPTSGLNKFGPYKGIKEPVIFYFYRLESERDKALKLYNFLVGKEVEENKYFDGFANTYGVTIDQTNIRGINADKHKKPLELENISKELLQKHPGYKLIVFAFSPRKEDGGDEKKRYLTLKYEFAQRSIPVQFVQYGTVTNNYSLKSAIPNIALAVFAKLGGEPWKVKPTNDDCLILGISQTVHNKPGSKAKKYVAYSVLLDTGGIYKSLEVLSADEKLDNYLIKLKENLKVVLETATTSYSKVVLHVTFKLRKKELEAITDTLKEFDTSIEFVVIRINTSNEFTGYDQSKGHLTPTRNVYLPLSSSKFLLWLEGTNNQNEVPFKRYSGPLYIEFHYSSKNLSSDEKKRYLQDLLNLSGANWRGLNAKAVPVSVYYCKLVAEYIMDFKETLDLEDLKSKFDNPWFL